MDQTLGARFRNENGESSRGLTYALPLLVFDGIGAALPAHPTVYRVR